MKMRPICMKFILFFQFMFEMCMDISSMQFDGRILYPWTCSESDLWHRIGDALKKCISRRHERKKSHVVSHWATQGRLAIPTAATPFPILPHTEASWAVDLAVSRLF